MYYITDSDVQLKLEKNVSFFYFVFLFLRWRKDVQMECSWKIRSWQIWPQLFNLGLLFISGHCESKTLLVKAQSTYTLKNTGHSYTCSERCTFIITLTIALFTERGRRASVTWFRDKNDNSDNDWEKGWSVTKTNSCVISGHVQRSDWTTDNLSERISEWEGSEERRGQRVCSSFHGVWWERVLVSGWEHSNIPP